MAVLKNILIIILLIICLGRGTAAQSIRFSMSTDLSLQHSFKKEQRFTVIGNTTFGQFHFTPVNTVYMYFAYYSNGNFSNRLNATAKSGTTSPQQIAYTNKANMRLKQLSIGWKRYLKGNAEAESGWNLYGYAGFGLILGRVENHHSVSIDTAVYDVPVISGRANFKRLTIDAGAGWEIPLGGELYFYSEGRIWVPTDGYPSRFIYVNDRAPWTAMLSAGIRVLF